MSTTSNKELYIGVFMFVAAVCSIAISGWQYKTAEGDFESGGDSLCEGMPFKYARPFFAHGNDQSSSGGIWCGYAASNTAYRLLIAALTVFWAIAVAVPGVANGMGKTYFYVTLFVGALWFCATTADCTAVAMANGVCRNFFGGPNAADYGIAGVYSCESEYYGITITLDFVLSSTLLGALLLFEDDTVSAEYSPPPAKAAPQEEEEPEKPADNMA